MSSGNGRRPVAANDEAPETTTSNRIVTDTTRSDHYFVVVRTGGGRRQWSKAYPTQWAGRRAVERARADGREAAFALVAAFER